MKSNRSKTQKASEFQDEVEEQIVAGLKQGLTITHLAYKYFGGTKSYLEDAVYRIGQRHEIKNSEMTDYKYSGA